MSEDFSTLHWQVLRKKLMDAGIEYKSKEQAIADLTALAAKTDAPVDGDPATPATPEPQPLAPVKSRSMLDRDKPYGVISGEVSECPSARFSQGGALFNSEGQKVG